MRYLITGGCGFIGSHIAEALVAKGEEVVVYDDLSSGYEANILGFRKSVRFIRGDIRDLDCLAKAMAGIERVFHEAALVSVFDSVERPADSHGINITGTLNVLLAARQAGVRRVVAASSAAVYGNDPLLPKHEAMLPRPESPYALAKIALEHQLSVFHKLYGLETVSLRYFNVYGPRQDPGSMYSGVISKFTDVLSAGGTPTVFGDGSQSRDFVFVRDVVQANLLAMNSAAAGRGEAFNIATGTRLSLLELLAVLGRVFERDAKPLFKPVRPGDIQHSLADITAAKKAFGYEPRSSIAQGLGELVAHAQSRK